MPAQDGTGPRGMGPLTGRGFGPCCIGMGRRQRFGTGRGMGRFFNWSWPNWRWPKNKADEQKGFEEYEKALRGELAEIEKAKKELKPAE